MEHAEHPSTIDRRPEIQSVARRVFVLTLILVMLVIGVSVLVLALGVLG